jgi:hypothetical protein
MAGYPGYGYGGGMMGGMYNPFMMGYGSMGSFGGYGGGMYNPYSAYSPMFGGGYMMPGYQSFGDGFLDQFQAQLDDMFQKYFANQQAPEESATGDTGSSDKPDTNIEPTGDTNIQDEQPKPGVDEPTYAGGDYDFGKNFGTGYLKTGELGEKGMSQATEAYGSEDAFWASQEGQRLKGMRDRRQIKKNGAPIPKPKY